MSEIARCPKCGYPNIYLGATKIECGYDKKCENYTIRQADEVEKDLEEKFPSVAEFGELDELDWDPEEEDTQPYEIPFNTD